MAVLVVNAGSSTLKLRVLDSGGDVTASVDVDPWAGDEEAASAAMGQVAGDASIACTGHRVVHGGARFRSPVVVDDAVIDAIDGLTPLAPLHQPRAVAGLRAARTAFPSLPAVACFDTAFHATLPDAAATYALPRAWRERWAIRRYGFHGLSHAYAVRRAADLVGRPLDGLRVVSCHLGAGASLSATVGGRSVDTTMGFTPLEGLVMATRAGSVDPGLVVWLIEHGGLDAAEVGRVLDRESGLAGLAGGSGDLREVVARRAAGDTDAALAFDVYVHRLRREIAAMVAATNGLDVLVFTGGVGEHQPLVRAAAAEGVAFLGIALDSRANEATHADGEISSSGAPVRTVVVTAREDREIARQASALLSDEVRR